MNEQIKKLRDNESYGSRVKVDGRSRTDVKALATLEKTTHCEQVHCGNVVELRDPVFQTTIEVQVGSSYHSKTNWPKTNWPKTQNSKLRSLVQSRPTKIQVKFRYLNQLSFKRLKMIFSGLYPHHPVDNLNKPGKVRRVCNAASQFE